MPTLADLVDSLDWSASEAAFQRWQRQQPPDPERTETPQDFRRRFRIVLVEQALYSDDAEVRADAQRMLQLAGVWTAIKQYLERHGLIQQKQ